ncbi:unnamed protein product [Nezara viridula]|nr:unnamed protein product [Nezara viridula]
MGLNSMYLFLIIFLFLWTKNSKSFSEIHSQVTHGSSFKLKCPIKTNNHYLVKWYKDGKELCR